MLNETIILLQFAFIILCIILAKSIRHINQAMVLGQIFIGMIIATFAHYKINFFLSMINNDVFLFLAELGSIFLLFEIGLESNLSSITNAGKNAVIVALTGVIVPFTLGYFVVTPIIMSNVSNDILIVTNNPEFYEVTLQTFIGSILAITSTGISVSVFKELNLLQSQACKIVLAASIIDDIMGLALLSIVTSLALSSRIDIISIGVVLLYILLFFIISILVGQKILPKVINLISVISNNSDTLVLIMISYALCMSFFASAIGLASVIGAFIAGLLLEKHHFNKYKSPNNSNTLNNTNPNTFGEFINNITPNNLTGSSISLEHLIKPFGKLLTPIFFIYAGMQVDIISAFNFITLKLTFIISVFAIVSKIVAGYLLPKTSNRLIIGIGMVPRGEIGLIFATTGLSLKIINHEIFSAIVLMIVVTSIFTPPLLTYATKKSGSKLKLDN